MKERICKKTERHTEGNSKTGRKKYVLNRKTEDKK
jgi:hypothetical protein